MYTVLWRENNTDKWDRIEDKDDVLELLETLKNNPNVYENDTWIFMPQADDHAKEYSTFLAENA